MSLYGTYRPKSFADVVGQDHIVTTLEQAIRSDKLAHAYLFAGSRGTGKTSVARILAKIILTRGIADDTVVRQMIAAVEDGSLVDLMEIDAASNRGIDDIRSLLEKIQFTPVIGKAKVFIIDEVHMLTREAFNALLKTLEEPPPYAYFILATTELFKIPPTIQSRCQRFLFRQIREEEIIRRLQYVADQEHIEIDRTALRQIAHAVQGSMRDALSLLDQLRSLPRITLEDVKVRVGESGHEYVEAILAAIHENKQEEILAIVGKMEEAAVPLETFLRLLLRDVRTQLHERISTGQEAAALLRMLSSLLEAVRDVRSAPLPGLALESALLALCSPNTAPVASLKQAKAAAPSPQPTASSHVPPPPAVSPAPVTTVSSIEAPECTIDALRKAWPGVIMLTMPPSVRMSMKDARLQELKDNNVLLCFSSAFHRDKVSALDASRTIEGILQNIFKRPLRLQCVVETDTKTPMAEEVVNLADAAAEIF
jgi:DNA polymerase III subunit gamma/tau